MSEIKGNTGVNGGLKLTDSGSSFLGCNNDYSALVTCIQLPGIWTINTFPLFPLGVNIVTNSDGNTQIAFLFREVAAQGGAYQSTCEITDSGGNQKELTINFPWSFTV